MIIISPTPSVRNVNFFDVKARTTSETKQRAEKNTNNDVGMWGARKTVIQIPNSVLYRIIAMRNNTPMNPSE